MNNLFFHQKQRLINSYLKFELFCCVLLVSLLSFGQQVPIQNYSVNSNGQVQLEVNSQEGKYYLLQAKHHPDSSFFLSSITLGEAGTTIISEPLRAYPLSHYAVLEFSSSNSEDSDNDGIQDIAEYNNMPLQAPINAATSINQEHALLCLNAFSAFQTVSTNENTAPWLEYLNGMEFVKYMIVDFDSDFPKVYFINSNNYDLHANFANYIGVDHLAPSVKKGQIIYHPNVLSTNGTLGTFGFNFTNNEAMDFAIVQRTQELLATNMPFIANNLAYFITENNEEDYQENITSYQNSRVSVLFETDLFAGINYWGLHEAESFGFFRLMTPGEVPASKDIVLYESLPNNLPRVGGIITSALQTPLSHVNLRAIHDNVPNAFIRDPLEIDSIVNLLDHFVYFKTNQSGYVIREATLDEVNAWYENIRPDEEQIPPLNLSYTEILPLEEINFGMYDAFGAKVANVATMRTFGFVDGTVPDGFGIPFYFYREFMEYNGFFDEIAQMIQEPDFIENRLVREQRLDQLRDEIKNGAMPDWMMDKLAAMQNSFPIGTSIRCRSSTNNEDLPGFSGAGLYDSKTHHPDENHISKTIKQVYASLWNLRAFEERDFYRVNHFYASMGVLCHPNFEGEKVNGVGVSADPVYNTDSTFYLNSQVQEELITNPNSSFPEELILKRYPDGEENYSIIRYSSIAGNDSLLMTDEQLDLLRQYLSVIHDEFAVLYHAVNNPTFAMDIEFKIDSTNKLAIKQARPWVSYVPTTENPAISDNCDFVLYPNPADNRININCADCGLITVRVSDMKGSVIIKKSYVQVGSSDAELDIEYLQNGTYFLSGYIGDSLCKTLTFIKH